MILLLTNDDGLGSPGLHALEEALKASHEIWVIAPDKEMSGQSHSITLNEGLKISRFSDERRIAVHGTPVDCVNIAFQAIMPCLPDLVISGINKGPNLGTDILYSGTCAAAREASLRAVPSVAVSFASFTGPWEFGRAASFISGNLQNLIQMWDEDRFLNINWPENYRQDSKISITRPGKRRYKDELVSFRSPRGGEYWFLQPAAIESSDIEGTDTQSIMNGDISISPIAVEPVLAPKPIIHDMIDWRGV
ncbi:MAG: 5'/3'-nucleotidase SurE [Spirochaetaceae bacterium]|nr:5'/3'-nucleotidase SurE [Spirochaetaceae bacterium]